MSEGFAARPTTMTTLAEVVITCGEPVTFKKSVFQAYAAPAKSIMVSVRRGRTRAANIRGCAQDVEHVLSRVRKENEHLAGTVYQPYAFRIQHGASYGPGDDVDVVLSPQMVQQEPNFLEDSDDVGETGTGDKLLHLLQRWDIQNAVLIVTRHDTGVPGRLGAQRYKVRAMPPTPCVSSL